MLNCWNKLPKCLDVNYAKLLRMLVFETVLVSLSFSAANCKSSNWLDMLIIRKCCWCSLNWCHLPFNIERCITWLHKGHWRNKFLPTSLLEKYTESICVPEDQRDSPCYTRLHISSRCTCKPIHRNRKWLLNDILFITSGTLPIILSDHIPIYSHRNYWSVWLVMASAHASKYMGTDNKQLP